MTKKELAATAPTQNAWFFCSKDSFIFNGSLVFQINFCGKSPTLQVVAKR